MRAGSRLDGRRGTAIVLLAGLTPVMVGLTALSVDTAALATAKAQLQTGADSAALAAAMQLASDRRVQNPTSLTPEITAAQAQASSVIGQNPVLGVAPTLSYTSGAASGTSSDLVVGYLDTTDTSSAGPSTSASPSLYNSVQVFARRDSSHGGAIPSFFGGLFHAKNRSLTVSSIATVQNYTVAGHTTSGTLNAHLLPIVLAQANYNAMMAGTTSDQYSYDTTTGAVTAGSDGVKESLLYPVSVGSGNWGTIKVGVSNNSTAILSSQIRYGITPTQLATFPGSTIELDSSKSPPSITFSGNPGISSGIKDDLTSIIGQPVTIPIYDQEGGNGNNATYRVIAFATVRIVYVDFQGNPKYVIVQPALTHDATAIPGTPLNGHWEQGGVIQLHLTR